MIVDDSFADGDRAKTGALDTNWWTSSSSAADEISVGSLGLVTGSSGRGLHTIFPTQTLSNIGDRLTATYTFTTPDTIDSNNGSQSGAFRVGLFDGLGRAALDADVSSSSGSPNEVYGWGAANGFPDANGPTPPNGPRGLPGYMLDMDVHRDGGTSDPTSADLNFREHSSTDDFLGNMATGRLMATTGNGSFSSFTSGPDAGYTFAPNTQYVGSFAVERVSATEFELTGTLGTHTYSVVDEFDSDSFSMLAFHNNSRTFGTSNSAGEPDNGIDFSNIKIEFSVVPEPSTLVLLSGSLLAVAGLRRK